MGAAAGTGLPGEDADILGAVAQEREAFLVEGCEDEFALGTFREHFTGLGVDDLCVEVVLIDMHACLLLALEGHAGAGGLCKTVDIISLDSEALLDALAHLLGPGLRAENTGLELVVFGLISALCQGLA